MATLVVATQPFSVVLDDKTNVIVHDGDVYPANDPVVKGREHLFEPANPATVRKR
jgi:hypothetical protein